MHYLYLTGGSALGLFLRVFLYFSWFLDEGKWFVHDRCVVHMAGLGAGGAGRGTPGRCGTLRAVKHRRCRRCPLDGFTAASAQYPLSSATGIYQKMSSISGRI